MWDTLKFVNKNILDLPNGELAFAAAILGAIVFLISLAVGMYRVKTAKTEQAVITGISGSRLGDSNWLNVTFEFDDCKSINYTAVIGNYNVGDTVAIVRKNNGLVKLNGNPLDLISKFGVRYTTICLGIPLIISAMITVFSYFN